MVRATKGRKRSAAAATTTTTTTTATVDSEQPAVEKAAKKVKQEDNTVLLKEIKIELVRTDENKENTQNGTEDSSTDNKVAVKRKGRNSKPVVNKVSVKNEPDDDDVDMNEALTSTSTSKAEPQRGRSKRAAAAKASNDIKNKQEEEKQEEKKPVSKRGRSKKAIVKVEADSEDSKKQTGKKAKAKAKSSKGKDEEMDTEPKEPPKKKSAVERTVVKKGRAAVDSLCPVATASHVLDEGGTDIWDCLLNQTNIQFNNNKYYIIQLLEDDKGGVYSVWMRWGRVGANGQNCLKPCGPNLNQAKAIFTKKFSDKTENDWEDRDDFEKVPGKYDVLQMDYSDAPSEEMKSDQVDGPTKKEPKKEVVSMLQPSIKLLVELICDVKVMEAAVVEMKYDADKAPLGKLTKQQIKAGYLALVQISNIVNQVSGKTDSKKLLQACNDFYTRVPHYFGMKVPPLIRTPAEVKEKLQLLEALGDIEAAMKFINQGADLDDGVHPADRHYTGLQCDMKMLEPSDDEYKLVCKYVHLNHGSTHTNYKLKVEDVFECIKDRERDGFARDIGNRMLLWHGSRLSNWAGILSQGLRIAPPEAPVTGYMFGKGIYFADMCSKSANYCMASSQNSTGLLVLCEVALGTQNLLKQADHRADKMPSKCHSVKGVGRLAPEEANFVTMNDGVKVPLGPAVSATGTHSLIYNEYIVYSLAQVRLRYLVKVTFDFNSW